MESIETIRRKIDEVDAKILAQLVRRALLAKDIGRVKSKTGSEIYSSAREQEIINRLISKKIAPLHEEDIDAIFREIFNACRNVQRKLRVAFFGPEATYTHQVALKHFGRSSEMLAQKSIGDVFSEVEKGRADYGVVPIENSTEGVVNHTLDMFMESDLVICAEREEPISHYLLSSPGQIAKIKRVYSHPQALAQCRKWLQSHLPNVEIHEAASTADAACQASLDGSAGAVASALAAKIYNLKIAAPNIEDFDQNFTRFLVIGKHVPVSSGHDKTSILFSIKDKIGALNDILLIFKNFNINLTKIESRPSKKKAWEYIFYVDFMGHSTNPKIQEMLSELRKSCLRIKILGSYPRCD